jgi:16S rRNA G527 N7-methylase RsmG
VLAIARPDLRIALVEPMLRRAAFLQTVVTELELTGVEIHRVRAEEFGKGRPAADVVTARAVAKVERLAALAAPLLRHRGELLAIKGDAVYDEMATGWPEVQRANMTLGAALFSIHPAHLPVQPSMGWLAGVEATCTATWDGMGMRTTGQALGAESLALVLRLGRS